MLNRPLPTKDFKKGILFNTNLILNYAASMASPKALN